MPANVPRRVFVKKVFPQPRKAPAPRRWSTALARLTSLGRSLRPEWVFLALALVFGIVLLLLTPPFEVPDEEAHFRRAFEISEGRIIALKQGDFTGDYLPPAIQELFDRFKPIRVRPDQKTSGREILDTAGISLDAGDREFVPFSNSAIHSPLTYLPQSAAIFLTRRFTSSALLCLYAGRLLNLLAVTAMTFFAIRLTPVAKWGFVTLAITPMALALDASLSPDALTNSLAFMLIAQVLACTFGSDEPVSWRALVFLALTGVAIGLAKQAYFLLPLCYLLIPVRKLGGARRYWMGLALIQGMTFLAVAGWALVVRRIYSPADASFGMNPEEQIRGMAADPLGFARAIWETILHFQLYGEEYLGWLGLADLRLPVAVYFVEIALILLVFLGSFDETRPLTNRQALVAAGVAALVSLTVLVVIHITWDAVGAKSIGLQGRYFIPVGPLVGIAVARLAALAPRSAHGLTRAMPGVVVLAIPIVLVLTVVCLYDRYFYDSKRSAAARLTEEAEVLFQKDGERERARALFEEAVKLDPDNARAHLSLGVLLQRVRPREAADHLRIVLRLDPDDVAALNNLANILRDQGEFPEAIRLYRAALKLQPDEERLQENLNRALKSFSAVQDAMRNISRDLEALAKTSMLEERHKGTPLEGLYLKANRGRVLKADGKAPFPVEFFWRCPPPNGSEIRLFNGKGEAIQAEGRVPFYACCGQAAGPNRVFVFPAPRGVEILADEEMSWFYQVPMADLTPEERDRERTYREKHGLHCPLVALPD
jgi:uncharacterized membrane protein/Tfp pilus assembly protein PilF